MTVTIKTELHPLRLSLRAKEPCELTIKIKNTGKTPKLLSLELVLPEQLGLDKAALNKGMRKTLGELKAGDESVVKTSVYINPPLAQAGTFAGKIDVIEHIGDYSQILRTYSNELSLRIV